MTRPTTPRMMTLAALTGVIYLACSSEATRNMGDMLVDAGNKMKTDGLARADNPQGCTRAFDVLWSGSLSGTDNQYKTSPEIETKGYFALVATGQSHNQCDSSTYLKFKVGELWGIVGPTVEGRADLLPVSGTHARLKAHFDEQCTVDLVITGARCEY